MARPRKLQNVINDFFCLVDECLQQKNNQNENGAYLLLYWLEKIAAEFKVSEFIHARNFQDNWLDRQLKIKKFAMTSDFHLLSCQINQNLEQVIEADRYAVIEQSREEGNVRLALKKAINMLSS